MIPPFQGLVLRGGISPTGRCPVLLMTGLSALNLTAMGIGVTSKLLYLVYFASLTLFFLYFFDEIKNYVLFLCHNYQWKIFERYAPTGDSRNSRCKLGLK
jgi:hypothetical protein